jgi:hypothetical protein
MTTWSLPSASRGLTARLNAQDTLSGWGNVPSGSVTMKSSPFQSGFSALSSA